MSAIRCFIRWLAPPQTENVLLVQINPLDRKNVPKTTKRDSRAHKRDHLQFVADVGTARHNIRGKLIDEGKLPRGIGDGQIPAHQHPSHCLTGAAQTLDTASRLNTDYDFFEMLRNNGQRAARRFLDAHYDDIGVRIDRRFRGRAGNRRRVIELRA